jgi:hypothetical protein
MKYLFITVTNPIRTWKYWIKADENFNLVDFVREQFAYADPIDRDDFWPKTVTEISQRDYTDATGNI